jgi:hypothetical protein
MSVHLGDEAVDTVTGFKGIVTERAVWLHGCDRVVLQPRKLGADGRPQDSKAFDTARVKVKKKGVVSPTVLAVIGDRIEMGDLVRCKITKFEGIVLGASYNIGGPVRYGVQPKKLVDGAPVKELLFDEGDLEIRKKGVLKPVASTFATPALPENKGTGGPERDHHSRQGLWR